MSSELMSLLAGGVGGSVAAFLAKTWIEKRLAASIKHEYDRQLEQYKKELNKKDKVELVAELFAEWIAIPPGDLIPKEQRTRLNQLSFTASLWLPPALVIEMSKVLQLKSNAKSLFDILLLAREEIYGDELLTPEHITFWEAKLEKKGQPVIQK